MSSSFVVSGCVALGLGFRADTVLWLVFPKSLPMGAGAGVGKAFALALVVFAPNGARVLGPVEITVNL